jgi:glycolate oxidase iron-sulfur subunit
MQTNLADFIRNTREGEEADAILRACVHCGFCTATCPTYQLLGDELDGPRGRIYLIKQVLEGAPVTTKTQQHLDRCLTCRNCETTCPSGVKYSRLVDIGRKVVEQRVQRPFMERMQRLLVREGVSRKAVFGAALAAGRLVQPLLSPAMQDKLPARQPAGVWPARSHARKMLVLDGCVQPAMAPNINAATARVLDALGVQLWSRPGRLLRRLRHHLNEQEAALDDMRRNIDAWWPCAGWDGGSHRDDGLRLRRHRQGIWPPAGARCSLCGQGAAVAAATRDLSEVLPNSKRNWRCVRV